MSKKISVAVVGCGIFGAMAALRLAQKGASVTLFDRQDAALRGASFNNQNRLHLGFHYPRDDETARQCIRGFQSFRDEFSECIVEGFPNAYFIASQGSFVTAEQYLLFCQRLGLSYERIDVSAFKPSVQEVDLGVVCDEVVYDCSVLRTLVMQKLAIVNIRPRFNAEITEIKRAGKSFILDVNGQSEGAFDAVVNCTYADINRITQQLGYSVLERQFEYTMVPIIKWDQSAVGITIMDGPFMTVLPFGLTGNFLLYHVDHTVVERFIGNEMPKDWFDLTKTPSSRIDGQKLFERMRKACSSFVPALQSARLVGFLQGPRVVLANRDVTDARPSIIQKHDKNYLSVFTGKIDHCVWVADEIATLLVDQ